MKANKMIVATLAVGMVVNPLLVKGSINSTILPQSYTDHLEHVEIIKHLNDLKIQEYKEGQVIKQAKVKVAATQTAPEENKQPEVSQETTTKKATNKQMATKQETAKQEATKQENPKQENLKQEEPKQNEPKQEAPEQQQEELVLPNDPVWLAEYYVSINQENIGSKALPEWSQPLLYEYLSTIAFLNPDLLSDYDFQVLYDLGMELEGNPNEAYEEVIITEDWTKEEAYNYIQEKGQDNLTELEKYLLPQLEKELNETGGLSGNITTNMIVVK